MSLSGTVSPGDEAKLDWVRRVLAVDVIGLRQPPEQNSNGEDEGNGSVDGSDGEKYLVKDEETKYTPVMESGLSSIGTQFNSVSLDNNSLSNNSSSSSSWSSSSSSTDSVESFSGSSSGPRGSDTPLPEGMSLSGAGMGAKIKGGSFGTVSWLKDSNGQMPLVIKVPKNEATRTELEHEAEFYAKVGPHENIAGCLGMQTIDGEQGLVLEGIKGGDMRKVMEQLEKYSKSDPETTKQSGMNRNLSHAEYMGTMQYMLRETLKGLAFLEEQGVVHTDIRPDNVMCDSESGAVKIVDFGLAYESGNDTKGRKMPIGHGMVAPEQVKGPVVNSNADVFATGELMRQVMEGGEFRYNKDDPSQTPTFGDAINFGAKDDEGKYKQALNPMQKPSTPPEGDDGGKATPQERMSDLRSNIARLLKDPLLKKNDTVITLGRDIQNASRNLDSIDEDEIDALEGRLGVVERGLKTSGGYRAVTSYSEFVNWAMHPDPTQRPSAKEALNHPFLQDSMLEDEQAREVLKKMLAPSQQQTIPLDSGSDSSSSTSSSLDSTSWSTSSTDSDGSVGDHFGDVITRKTDDGYTEFQTADGGWTRNSRQAVRRQKDGGGRGQDSGSDSSSFSSSTSSTGSLSSPTSSTDSVGSVNDGLGEFITRRSDGYMEFQTADGGWTRDRTIAVRRSKDGGGASEGSGGDGTGRQYDDLTEAMRNPQKYGTSPNSEGDGQTEQPGTGEKQPSDKDDLLYVNSLDGPEQKKDGSQDAPQDGKSGGWTETRQSGGTQRGGPTIGRNRGSGETAPQPEEGKGGWTETRQSEGTQRGGATIGRNRGGGTAPQGTPQPEEGKKDGWTETRPSEGTQRGGPTMGRGRGGTQGR